MSNNINIKNKFNSPYSKDFKYLRPDTIYRDRLETLGENILYDECSESRLGRWRGGREPGTLLHLDIGCGIGEYLLSIAPLDPLAIFIGIDWKCKNIHKAGVKSNLKNIKNIFWLRAHAERLKFIFAENEVSKITIFFPDPWPKRKQNKNRLFSEEFLDALFYIINKNGSLEIRTDHNEYFEEIFSIFKSSKLFTIKECASNIIDANNPTKFQNIFLTQGIGYNRLFALPNK